MADAPATECTNLPSSHHATDMIGRDCPRSAKDAVACVLERQRETWATSVPWRLRRLESRKQCKPAKLGAMRYCRIEPFCVWQPTLKNRDDPACLTVSQVTLQRCIVEGEFGAS